MRILLKPPLWLIGSFLSIHVTHTHSANPTPPQPPTPTCVEVLNIDIIGSALRRFLLQHLRTQYKHPRCLTTQHIGQLIESANGIALTHGYITTRIGLKTPQDIAKSKTLTLSVTDGIIHRITYTDNQGNPLSYDKALSLQHMFSDLQGSILNIHRIDDRIEKLNQLTLFHTSMEIIPGKQPGHSTLRIIRTPKRPFSLSSNYTHGLLPNSKESIDTKISVDNLLSLNEKWQLSHNLTLPDQHNKHTRTNGLNLTIPWRSQLWSLSHSLSNNSRLDRTAATDILTESETQQNALGWQITLKRNTQNRFFAFASIDNRVNEVDINQTRSPVSSHKNSTLEAGIKANHYRQHQTLNWQIKIRSGQDWFDGDEDKQTFPNSPRNQFTRVNLEADITQPIVWQKHAGILSFRTHLQFTDDILLSHERLSYPYDSTHSNDKGLFAEGTYLWQTGANLSHTLKLKTTAKKILSGLNIKFIAAGIWHQRNSKNADGIEQYNLRHQISYSYKKGWLEIGAIRSAESWKLGTEENQNQSLFIKIQY